MLLILNLLLHECGLTILFGIQSSIPVVLGEKHSRYKEGLDWILNKNSLFGSWNELEKEFWGIFFLSLIFLSKN
jgi:hypothetical protein